jgi:signal transduction histidine kinase
MSNLQFFHHKLYRQVQYFEWALLALAFIGTFSAWKYAPHDPSAPNLLVSLFLLVIVALLSFFTPLEGTFWDRFCFIFMETIILTGATAAGLARFVFPLYTVVMAKGCLILDRRGLWITGTMALIGQIVWEGYKIVITMPGLLKHGWTFPAVVAIIGGAFVMTYVGIAVMILVGMLTLLLVSEQKSRLETERLSKEVEALAAELERSRIAREIHDSLGHTLTTLNVQLDLGKRFATEDPERSQQALVLAKELATQSLNDVRLAVQSIRNANFDLKQAVGTLVEDVRQSQALTIEMPVELPELPPAVGFQLFRVIQECLTNVLKHANASLVTIEVKKKDNTVELQFADNGRGVTGESPDGYGIKGMKERVESMRGSLSIDTEVDKGTRIQVSIPL